MMDNRVKRIGVLVPPANVAMEAELPLFAPPGVRCNFNRLSREGRTLTKDSLLSMEASVTRAAGDLSWCNPDVIVYGCTSGTFLNGLGTEDTMARRIKDETGVAAVTTATAVIEALRAVGAHRIFMVTPYPDAVNEEEIGFLGHYGFQVVAYDSFRFPLSAQVPEVPSEQVTEFVLRHRAAIAGCDTLFVSCTNLLVMDQIDILERELRVPVVTSNQASLWAALTRIGAPAASGCGSLFRPRRSAAA